MRDPLALSSLSRNPIFLSKFEKLLPVNSSAAVNSLENYGPVNSLSVKNVKQ
jgi:hypothetical protein